MLSEPAVTVPRAHKENGAPLGAPFRIAGEASVSVRSSGFVGWARCSESA